MDTSTTRNPTTTLTTNTDAFARLDRLFSQVPDHIYDWLFSEQTAKNVAALGKKFGLTESQTVQMSRITGLAILKEFSLPNMALELKKTLNLDGTTIQQLAVDIALMQFLPIRDYLQETENFIKQLGASLPAVLPPLIKSSPTINYKTASTPTSASALSITVTQKTLRQLAQENKEAFNQNLTTAPIKITDFDQPVRPTIKNWLVDYVKIKGAGHHETLARNDYLFNSVNAQSLTAKERELVASILNAYDNDTPLPINAQDQTILLNEISTESPPAVNRLASKPIQPAVPRGERSELYGSYREPISQEDLSGPMKPAPSKPAPRLSGNIIDLSNISDK